MCAYSLRKFTARLAGHEVEDERPTTPFDQLERELALYALPKARSPRLVTEVPEHEPAAA
jgi:hypothetical protein